MPGKDKHSAEASNRRKSSDYTGRMFELSQPLLLDSELDGEIESKGQVMNPFNALLADADVSMQLCEHLGINEAIKLRVYSREVKASVDDSLKRLIPVENVSAYAWKNAWEKLNDLHDDLCIERKVRREHFTDADVDCVSCCGSCCCCGLLMLLLLCAFIPKLQHIFGLSAVLLGNVVVSAAVPSLCWGAYSLMAVFNSACYKNPCLDGLSDNFQAAIKDTLGRCTSIETGKRLEIKGSMRLNTIIKLCERYRAFYFDKMADSLSDGVDQAGSGTAHHDDGSGSGAALAARAAREVDALGGSDQRRGESDDSDDDQQENAVGTGGAGAYVDGATRVVVTFRRP